MNIINFIFFLTRVNEKIMTFENIMLWLTHFVFSYGSRDFLTINLFMAHGDATFFCYVYKLFVRVPYEKQASERARRKFNFPPALTFIQHCLKIPFVIIHGRGHAKWWTNIIRCCLKAIITSKHIFLSVFLRKTIKIGFRISRKSFFQYWNFILFFLLFSPLTCLHYK